MKNLNESLDYHDMVGYVTPVLGIDEFESRIGDDSEIIVLNFIVSGSKVGENLVDWLERGYDWIIDAEISPGEVLDKKYYVFAEINRTSNAPRRIMEVLDDLNTLTDIKKDGWKIKIDGKKYPASEEIIKEKITLSSSEYKNNKEGELNEWREIAGLPTVKTYEIDDDILNLQRQARII